MGLRGWSHDFPTKSKMADGGHIEFSKVLLSPYWMKIFAKVGTNYKDAARPCRDPISPPMEPEYSRDVISRTWGRKWVVFSDYTR